MWSGCFQYRVPWETRGYAELCIESNRIGFDWCGRMIPNVGPAASMSRG